MIKTKRLTKRMVSNELSKAEKDISKYLKQDPKEIRNAKRTMKQWEEYKDIDPTDTQAMEYLIKYRLEQIYLQLDIKFID